MRATDGRPYRICILSSPNRRTPRNRKICQTNTGKRNSRFPVGAPTRRRAFLVFQFAVTENLKNVFIL